VNITERIKFRFMEMPCCHQLLCWVNPRLPSFCPECGTFIHMHIRENILVIDDNATLKYEAPRQLVGK
jgi:hypothetical protein